MYGFVTDDSPVTNDPFQYRAEFRLLFLSRSVAWLLLNINLNEIGYLYRTAVHRQLMKCELRQILVLVYFVICCKQLYAIDDNLTRCLFDFEFRLFSLPSGNITYAVKASNLITVLDELHMHMNRQSTKLKRERGEESAAVTRFLLV